MVGAETSDLAGQLATLSSGYRPHVAVIVVGGNDITHRVRTAESRRHLAEAVGTLRDTSETSSSTAQCFTARTSSGGR
jgi:hypothetical protein